MKTLRTLLMGAALAAGILYPVAARQDGLAHMDRSGIRIERHDGRDWARRAAERARRARAEWFEAHRWRDKRWYVGDWSVDGHWNRYEHHYVLTATAEPVGLDGPELQLRCRDGVFEFALIGDTASPRARGLYAVRVWTEDHYRPVLDALSGGPHWTAYAGDVTILAARAEIALANARRIDVHMYYAGTERDYAYRFEHLAVGKPQLYNVCVPPPEHDVMLDGPYRGGWRGAHWRPAHWRPAHWRPAHWRPWPAWRPRPVPVVFVPINPPRYRSLSQEKTIAVEHDEAEARAGH